MDGWKDGWVGGWMGRQLDKWMRGMGSWLDECKNGWLEKWVVAWKDGYLRETLDRGMKV